MATSMDIQKHKYESRKKPTNRDQTEENKKKLAYIYNMKQHLQNEQKQFLLQTLKNHTKKEKQTYKIGSIYILTQWKHKFNKKNQTLNGNITQLRRNKISKQYRKEYINKKTRTKDVPCKADCVLIVHNIDST
jgi:hypothetical protein